MIPSALPTPRSPIVASVSWRYGFQFLIPTNTGSLRLTPASIAASERACMNVRSLGGERWVRPGCVVTSAASPARTEGGERWVRPGSVLPSLGGHLVDHVDERLHVIDGRVGQDAVAEVEDVARAAAGAAQDVGNPLADVRGLRHQHDGIEVALHRDVVTDGGPRGVELDPPVQADHAAARLAHER